MKKKDKESLDNLIRDVRDLKELQLYFKIIKLEEQLKCSLALHIDGTQGHKFKFMRKHFLLQSGVGEFMCLHCGIKMSRKLTAKEKEAIKTLGN